MSPSRPTLLLSLFLSSAAGAGVTLDDNALPAVGTQSTLMHVDTFGKVALFSRSAQGTALQIVDRMTGPGDTHGEPGLSDGRVDLFVERGDYKVLTHASSEGTGTVQLFVAPFTELNGDPKRLIKHRLVETVLGDYQQRSWWVQVDAKKSIQVEAQGRSLSDLRLWRDGAWLSPITPTCVTVSPVAAHPMTHCSIDTQLNPGLYLLTAYGGPPHSWTDGDNHTPLYVRRGLPTLAEAGQQHLTLSPFGTDRFRVNKRTDFFRAELPQKAPFSLGTHSSNAVYRPPRRTSLIEDDSRLPVAQLSRRATIVTLSGQPGQTVFFQHYRQVGTAMALPQSGPMLVTLLQSGHASDRAPLSAVQVTAAPRPTFLQEWTQSLDGEHDIEATFNLNGTTEQLIHIEEAGEYTFSADNTELRVEPFLLSKPPDYKTPPFVMNRLNATLHAGLHRLTLHSSKPLICALTVHPSPSFQERLLGSETRLGPPVEAVQFVNLSGKTILLRGVLSDQTVGLSLTPLPAQLKTSLPIILEPGVWREFPIKTEEVGRYILTDDFGEAISFYIDGAPYEGQPTRGNLFSFKNTGDSLLVANLSFVPTAADPQRQLPSLSGSQRPVALPSLREGAPVGIDLAKQASASWKLTVADDALYRLKTTGRLHTQATLRTRTRPQIASETENGAGHNAEVARYLGAGDYLLSVSAQQRSKGHLGVELKQTTLIDGGQLKSDQLARATVSAGDAIRYQITIDEPGRYRFASIGERKHFNCRFEDANGWPLIRPGLSCAQTLTLEPGEYSLTVLPEAVSSQRVTSFYTVKAPPGARGHGPHPLPFDRSLSHVWREDTGDTRGPDVWTFSLPAKANVALSLSGGMSGVIRSTNNQQALAQLKPVSGWEGTLNAGDYRVELKSQRPNNGLSYQLSLTPKTWVAGMSRAVQTPAELPVSIGDDGFYTFSSTGSSDVQAQLFDASGLLVTQNDDRPNDWNFRLSQQLTAGDYTLAVRSFDGNAQTYVQLEHTTETRDEALRPKQSRTLRLNGEVHLLPLQINTRAQLIRLDLNAKESVGLALEAQVNDQWRTLSQAQGQALVVAGRPSSDATAYRARLWSLDLREQPIQLSLSTPKTRRVSESQLQKGLTRVKAGTALSLSGTSPGVFSYAHPSNDLLVCPTPAAGCTRADRQTALDEHGLVWISGSRPLKAERLTLRDEQVQIVTVPARSRVMVNLPKAKKATLIQASAPMGQPVLSLDGGFSPDKIEISGHNALIVDLEGRSNLVALHNAEDYAMDVRLKATLIDQRPSVDQLTKDTVPAHSLREINRDEAVALTLSDGLILLDSDQRPHWSHDGGLYESLQLNRRPAYLLNPTDHAALYRLSPGHAYGMNAPVSLKKPLELNPSTSGKSRHPVRPGAGTLSVSGAVKQWTFLRADGRVFTSGQPTVGEGGQLILEHDAGPIAASIHTDEPAPWPATSGKNQIIKESGGVVLKATGQTLRLRPKSLSHVSLRADCDAMIRYESSEGFVSTTALKAGQALDLIVPTGESTLALRPAGPATLWGTAQLTFNTPQTIEEGVGPAVLLTPGQTQLFRFDLIQAGPIGLGAKAQVDRVQMRLFDERGALKAEGRLQMPSLSAGRWYLGLTAPPESGPIVAQPVIVGLNAPDTGPPLAVIKDYLGSKGAH